MVDAALGEMLQAVGARDGRVRRFATSVRWPAVVLAMLVIAAVLAPFITRYDPNAQLDIVNAKNLAPSLVHPFGTDAFSRDVLSRVLYGARISLTVGALATVITVVLGTAWGAVAGFAGGIVDTILMRAVDAMLAIPRVLLLIVPAALWRGLSLPALVIILGATGWFGLSRLVRGQTRVLRTMEYVAAAQALGVSRRRVILRHILPNLTPIIVVAAALGIGEVIVLEAGLSFLGLGVQPPQASWGSIIQDGADAIGSTPWVALFPGLLIVVTVLATTTLGDAVRRRTTR